MRNSPLEAEGILEQNLENTEFTQKVAVEFIFTDGYFTNNFETPFEKYGRDNNKISSPYTDDGDFYNFTELGKNQLMSDHAIITELNKKMKEHGLEMSNFGVNVPYSVWSQPQFQQPPKFS
jgi:hypothetical protein